MLEEGFLQAIRSEPLDEEPRLIFADWLEDQGQEPRAQLIRLQCQLRDEVEGRLRWEEAQFQIRQLRRKHEVEWHAPVPPGFHLDFDRGLPLIVADCESLQTSQGQQWWDQGGPWVQELGLASPAHTDSDLRWLVAQPHFQSLSCLDLKENPEITEDGLLALQKLKQLKILRLPFLELNNSEWSTVSSLSHLHALEVSLEGVSGSLLRLFDQLPSLQELTLILSDTDYQGELESAGHLKKLHLTLWEEQEQLRLSPSLTELSLEAPSEQSLAGMESLEALTKLTLTKDGPSEEDLQILAGLPQLRTVSLFTNHMYSGMLAPLREMSLLEALEVRSLDVTHDDIWTLLPLGQLRELHIPIGPGLPLDRMAEFVSHFPGLRKLTLPPGDLTATGLLHLSRLAKLEELQIETRQVTGSELSHLEPMAHLRRLCLKGSSITDEAVPFLSRLTRLQWLDLLGARVSKAGLQELRKALPKTTIRG